MPKKFFDFEEVVKKEGDFDKLIKNAEKNIKTQKNSTSTSVSSGIYLLIGVLVFSLIGLGYYSWRQKNTNTTNTVAVSNKTTNKSSNILTGSGFSILLDRPTPSNFVNQEEPVDFSFLNNKKGTVTKILAKNEVKNTNDESGIEIYFSEYDNRLNIDSFAKEVESNLGNSFELDSETIEIPKGFSLHKITSNSNPYLTYYTTVTSENYYVIKINNSAAKYSNLKEYSEFIDLFIPGLFLN